MQIILSLFISFCTRDTLLYRPHFYLPVVPDSMNFGDFRLLKLKFDLGDYIIAGFFPGYMHFLIGKYRTGAGILLGRTIITGIGIYAVAKGYRDLNNIIQNPTKYRENLMWDMALLLGSAGLNLFFYALDIGAARCWLREQKMRIYYRYRRLCGEE